VSWVPISLAEELRDATRRLVERELDPLAQEVEREDRLPDAAISRLAELGYFGLTIPTEYGGLGLTTVAYCSVVREFGRTHSAFFQRIDDNNGMGSFLIREGGSEALRRRVLPELASGAAVASFALTEPEAGSDAGSLRTVARRDGADYVMTGQKHFISNAAWARYFTVVARTRPYGETDGRISAFLVERDTPGFVVGRRQEMMGLRGAAQHELIFEDCRIPGENLLGAEGDGFRAAKGALAHGRLTVAAWSLGAAGRALELGIAYARDRRQFGRPIGDLQGVQWLLADSATELTAAQALLDRVAEAVDAHTARGRDTAMVKLFATEVAGRVADRMLQVHGGAGYSKDLPIERIYRDLRVQRIIEGTSEVQRMIIAKSLLREADVAVT
jgi:acyl-CoA dehydrogenase